MEKEVHKRRVRYSGTHPKTYKEKYKELQPEKYPETVEKVIQKGSTPVGMHISIMVKEILDFLQIQSGQIGVDATLGYGGHTSHMLKCLEGKGHIYGLDVDTLEMAKTKERLNQMGYGEDLLTTKNLNFEKLNEIVEESGKLNFLLADLGVSSMQLDNPERGFSYKKEGPLDLRLDSTKGISAAERLKSITKEELKWMLIENSDEPYAEEIARKITSYLRKCGKIETTSQLQTLIEEALSFLPKTEQKELIKKSCQRTFQALRIDINREYEVLDEFMKQLPLAMEKDGRIAILTFHSGEDRIVKKAFQNFLREGVYKEISTEVVRPSKEECGQNARARSTKMRWAIKS